MVKQRERTVKAIFSIAILIMSMFSGFIGMAPSVQAANGLGEVTKFQNEADYPVTPPDVAVQTVNTEKEITFWIHNDEPVGGNCIDEILITFPDTWQGGIDVNDVVVTNLNDVIITNEKDDGSYTGLTGDANSIRIIPDGTTDGVMLCPSGTTKITIQSDSGLMSPANSEISEIMVMTSDEDHNEPSDSYVRQPISILPEIIVTEADGIKIEYIQKSDFSSDANADYRFTGKAWGAWGILDKLYVTSDGAVDFDVYLDNGDGVFDGADTWVIGSASLGGAGTHTVTLNGYTASMDVGSNIYNGYVKDGSIAVYFIEFTSGSASLTNVGHTDSARYLDPSVVGTGFEGTAEGTVITVNDAPIPANGRKVKVQLVKDEDGRLLDVQEDNIPIHYTALNGIGTFTESSPEPTDADGEAEITLLPGTTKGIENVEVCFPDVACVNEMVGINARPAEYCEITEGLDVSVETGDAILIEATVYDEFGNVITNVPGQELVEFDLTSVPNGTNDASLDQDTVLGAYSNHEEEDTQLGIADAYLHTSATIGEHTVDVNADGMYCGQTTITGTLGQADSVVCEILDENLQPIIGDQITADQDVKVLVKVLDKNGNPLPKWESLVEVGVSGPGGLKYIAASDLREELLDTYVVQGKLNNADQTHEDAWGIVDLEGCEELGVLEVTCKTDTLTSGDDSVDIVNSAPACIDVSTENDGCSDKAYLQTSILDTCGNKLVDQECSTGGFASSCVKLEASCGVLSTDKTCVDLGNTGMAPVVELDTSLCGCGDITITATDEPDCCPSVYSGTLPQCSDVMINKIGPATRIDMQVMPKAENQNNFWVSEKTILDLVLMDNCNQLVTCERDTVDVELTGEDCFIDDLQVDSPYTTEGTGECEFSNVPVHKVVMENCANASKQEGSKEWTDLPEQDDLVIDKIAFDYNGPTDNVIACVYEETEDEAGFQATGPNADLMWRCTDLSNVPSIPGSDSDNMGAGAYDKMHSNYIIELEDRISRYNGNNEYDNQRLGGAIVEPGDTKDFYIVLSSKGYISCGEYDADYLYYQDYNGPDILYWTDGGYVRDTLAGSEQYTFRNDDYSIPDQYPVISRTPWYGFGDRILYDLGFVGGKAQVVFNDLVAETVNIFVDSNLPVVLVDNGLPVTEDTQAEITYLTQPATQVVARNHGDLEGSQYVCDDVGFEPTYEFDPDMMEYQRQCWFEDSTRDCRPARACDGEGYDINLQIADGFQNQVGLATEIQLHSCMEYPHYVYLDDTFLPQGMNITIDLWDIMKLHDESTDPWDACFDMDKFTDTILMAVEHEIGPHEELKTLMGSDKFVDFVHSMFEGKDVEFVEVPGYPLSYDVAGNLVVTTDADGKAKVRVESDDSSFFQMKSFDTSFRLFFVPHALDADYFDVAFAPGEPAMWDVISIPDHGIPADGEQEAKLLIRKTDSCGNPVEIDEDVKVSVSGSAIISRDFSGNNNYDNEVIGSLSDWTCWTLMPWFEDCSLQIMNTVIEDVEVTVEDAICEEGGEAFCTGFPGCDLFSNRADCEDIGECIWDVGELCQTPGTTTVGFVGAPVKLAITEIKHSDLIPADGWKWQDEINLPQDACGLEERRQCGLFNNPDVCFKDCVDYGNTGAWVTVEVQDKYGDLVTGYLGDGLKYDPGDKYGKPDNVFENICVALDDSRAEVIDNTYGWLNFERVYKDQNVKIYCGDLAYGTGSFKVVYKMLTTRATGDSMYDEDQPFDPRETEKVIVSVFDMCDEQQWSNRQKPSYWDDQCNGQEYNENNLPDSETASMLNSDSNKIIFVAPADRWDINADRIIVAADGKDYAELIINTENEYFDVRQSLDATVQSSLLGSKLESEAITPGCYVKGISDPINPTSINVMTESCSGGQAKLRLSSTEQGVARVTVTGNNFGCLEWEVGDNNLEDMYTLPSCKKWGVMPMTPKTIEIEFKQAYQNEISLEAGWNFFSVPFELAPSNDQWSELGLNAACTASAMWDEATQSWVTPIPASTQLESMDAYWCKVNEDKTISVEALEITGVYLPNIKHIYPGWNDVGLATYVEMKIEHALISIDSIYTQILDWTEGMQRFISFANTGEVGGGVSAGTTGTEDMEAGQGYFIWANDEGDLPGQS